MPQPIVVLLACLAMGLTASARAEGYFLGLGVGVGDADIQRGIFGPGNQFSSSDKSDLLVGEFVIGYELASNVFIDLGVEGYDTFDFLQIGDVFDLDVVRAGVGFVAPSESRFHVFGKAGISFWDLSVRESALFNPGPEESTGLDGQDLFVQGGVEYRFNDSFRATLSFDYANLDFGKTTAIKLSIKIFP